MVNIFLGKSITDFAFAEGIYTTGISTIRSAWAGLVGVQAFQLLHRLTSRKVNIILALANTDTANWPFLWAIAGVFGTSCNMFLSQVLRSSRFAVEQQSKDSNTFCGQPACGLSAHNSTQKIGLQDEGSGSGSDSRTWAMQCSFPFLQRMHRKAS